MRLRRISAGKVEKNDFGSTNSADEAQGIAAVDVAGLVAAAEHADLQAVVVAPNIVVVPSVAVGQVAAAERVAVVAGQAGVPSLMT